MASEEKKRYYELLDKLIDAISEGRNSEVIEKIKDKIEKAERKMKKKDGKRNG